MNPVSELIRVDRSSPVPLYFQVAQRLEELIESGQLVPGTRLENEVSLADQLGLSRPTMRQAIQYLVDKGLLVRKRGVGTQVVHAKVRRTVELTSLYDDLDRTHQQPRTDVLSLAETTAPDEVAVALVLPTGAPVLAIERLRYAQGEPLAVMRNFLPSGLFPLTIEDLRARGLYQLMRAAGINLRLADQTIGARRATAAEAKALGEVRGAPLLTMARTAYDDAGRAVEYGQHAYRASHYSFELTLVAR
ncbi:GntR family transcriptional regulator [Phytohabitans rumicis]|uniref:Transcriptional regulator n=1 Tax=Phytohabitans rumicis TaxID=1076125 RepID=A0A6V8L243_9ACTN|nr:GntR family transcriptional regulator [Phytohabitans rumicis]GFJ88176.1 transcriptional regulator [Phytohabitans rumicis]